MSKSLNPYTLSNIYTIEQIQEKVVFFQEQLESATVKMYDKDTTQGRQRVESADLLTIESILSTWIKALELKTGHGQIGITSVSFNNKRFM